MRRGLLIFPLAIAGLLIWMWLTGGNVRLASWAAAWQREFQNALAGALRALRADEPGALGWMAGLCFAYGVAHAIGPGHGKVLIGGYGLGRRVPLGRLAGIASLSSLGQAVMAVGLVYGCLFLLGWDRRQMTSAAEDLLSPASLIAIGAVGLWLALRGALHLWRRHAPAVRHAPHDHHDHTCGCGHRHGPDLAEIQSATSLRDSLVLIASIAIRPCTGALFLLILTWNMQIAMAGIAGTLAMSAGTALVTIGVAIASTFARESTLLSLAGTGWGRGLMPWLEIGAGGLILLSSAALL